MNKDNIIILGDWSFGIEQIKSALKKEAFNLEVSNTSVLKDILRKKDYDIVFFALNSQQIESESNRILEAKQINDAVPIFVVSNNEHCDPATELMKLGISEYICCPFSKDKFKRLVQHHLKMYHITKKIFFSAQSQKILSPFENMVGHSEAMQENFRMISAVAKSNATVLVTGESGTGKELVAKAIHKKSDRVNHRMVDLNCGAIPRDLLENELFGHEKGSFTGAHRRYLGSFEAAHKGTLFLDEISEMDPLLQVKLLRVLQERSFMRIGGTEKIDVDVRIIAATNRNLQKLVETGQFREDLYYRLNVVNINIPPLRERREDIPVLAMHFLEYCSVKNDRIFIDFSNDAVEALINYDWPGNVRELENTIERVVVLHNDSQVKLKYLPKSVQRVSRSITYSEVARGTTDDQRIVPLTDLEKKAIEMAMMKFHGNVAIVAKKLKIGQATLYRKVKKYGLAQ